MYKYISHQLCPWNNTDDLSCIEPVYGCIESIALNYCDSCNVDDDSYLSNIRMYQEGSLNYSVLAIQMMDHIEIVADVSTTFAYNYDSNATKMMEVVSQ